MTWVKLDDQFADHPKIEAAGPMAAWLFVCGLCYASKHLTDGYIPGSVANRLANVPTPRKHIDQLVAVGLWHVEGEGYRIRSYLEYQPTAEEVEQRRRMRAEAGRRGGQKSGETRSKRSKRSKQASNAEANTEQEVEQNGKPNRTPSPSPNVGPDGPTVASAEPTPTKRGSRIPDDFVVDERMRMWASEHVPDTDWRMETQQFCDYHRAKGSTMKDWTAAWRTWMRNSQKWAPSRANARRPGNVEQSWNAIAEVFGGTS